MAPPPLNMLSNIVNSSSTYRQINNIVKVTGQNILTNIMHLFWPLTNNGSHEEEKKQFTK